MCVPHGNDELMGSMLLERGRMGSRRERVAQWFGRCLARGNGDGATHWERVRRVARPRTWRHALNGRRCAPHAQLPTDDLSKSPQQPQHPINRTSRFRLTLVRNTVRKTRPPGGPVFWTGVGPRKVAAYVSKNKTKRAGPKPFCFLKKKVMAEMN